MTRDVAYYLSKGFDQPMAEYFASGRKRIVAVTPNDDFTLTLDFDNGGDADFGLQAHPGGGARCLPPSCGLRRSAGSTWTATTVWPGTSTRPVNSEVVWSNKVDLSPTVAMRTAFPLEVCEMPDECAALIDQIIEERHRAGA